MCSDSTTQNKPELRERRRHLLKPLWSLWIGPLLRESFWRSRASTWSRRWRKGLQKNPVSYILNTFLIVCSSLIGYKYGLNSLSQNVWCNYVLLIYVDSLRWKSCTKRRRKKRTSFWSSSDWWVQISWNLIQPTLWILLHQFIFFNNLVRRRRQVSSYCRVGFVTHITFLRYN